MSDFAIELSEVQKVYKGGVEALRGISLTVPRGEVFGLLGPNGAGKSTLVKILTTIIKPTRCVGMLLGEPVGAKAVLKKVGYLPEHVHFPEYLTGKQVVEYAGGLAGMGGRALSAKSEELLEEVGMLSDAHRTMSEYSKGMKQRVGIAQALVNDPELVFLDEPTDGVDPEGRRDIRVLIDRMKEKGTTVFLNSHLLDELEQVADSVAILSKGTVIRQGSVEELTREQRVFELRTIGPVPFKIKELIEKEGGSCEVSGDLLKVHADHAEDIQGVIDLLRVENVGIREVKEGRLSLEQLFLQTVEGRRG